MALKDSWKETGKGLGHAFTGLGKTLVKTAKYAVNKAEDWAESGPEPTADNPSAPDQNTAGTPENFDTHKA